MSIKKFHFNKNVIAYCLLTGGLVLGTIGGNVAYFNYEKATQITSCESTVEDSDIFVDENGNFCKIFDLGKHEIKISRNDYFKHTYDIPEGYSMTDVETFSGLYNSKVTYTNNVLVVAKGKLGKDGKITFNSFGTPVEEKSISK